MFWAMADEEGLGWQDHMSRTFPTPHELNREFSGADSAARIQFDEKYLLADGVCKKRLSPVRKSTGIRAKR